MLGRKRIQTPRLRTALLAALAVLTLSATSPPMTGSSKIWNMLTWNTGPPMPSEKLPLSMRCRRGAESRCEAEQEADVYQEGRRSVCPRHRGPSCGFTHEALPNQELLLTGQEACSMPGHVTC